MKSIITAKEIVQQLKKDLIGKDSYRGVTLTYSWLANQFGHFSLGYLPTLFAYSLLLKYSHLTNPAFWSALIVSCIWLVFELYNFLGPLLIKKQSKSKNIFISSGQDYVFQPAWSNIAFDTITDLCFFWLGAFSAGLFLHFTCGIILTVFGLSLILLYPSYYWFVTKMYIQYARFPAQFRLSQWQGGISDNDEKIILNYVDFSNSVGGKHLLIIGGRRSGKSLLSIGIGTEFSIERYKCSYYTGIKLYNLFSLTDEEIIKSEDCDIWSWRKSSLLIIDDINPGNPIPDNFVSPEQILKFINVADGNKLGKENKEELSKKNVIWVLGDESNDVDKWKIMLQAIGVSKNNISAINLGYYFE